jgi:hypothetical protein
MFWLVMWSGCAPKAVPPAGPSAHGRVVVSIPEESGGSDVVETQELVLLSRGTESQLATALGGEQAPPFTVERLGHSAVLEIRVPGDSEESLRACNELLRIASSSSAGGNREAERWLKKQIVMTRQRLRDGEQGLEEFLRDIGRADPEGELAVLNAQYAELVALNLRGNTEPTAAEVAKRKEIAELREAMITQRALQAEIASIQLIVQALETRLLALKLEVPSSAVWVLERCVVD